MAEMSTYHAVLGSTQTANGTVITPPPSPRLFVTPPNSPPNSPRSMLRCSTETSAPSASASASTRRRKFQSTAMQSEVLSACLGMSKAIEILGGMESAGSCGVEKSSVYGAAIALPQVARSACWPKTICCLSLRAYIFVVLNYLVQGAFIYYIYDSQTNMGPFSSQMHLCDFGAHISECAETDADDAVMNCRGPGGTHVSDPGSLYGFGTWNTRKFVRRALTMVFPDRKDDIFDAVNPGEYGVQSYTCRLLCIFVFMVSIADEFQNILDLVKLLCYIPAEEGSWVSYDPPSWASKEYVKDVRGMNELQMVRYMVNGMPIRWKLWNSLFLLVPKVFLWRMLTMAGVHFLMETAAMVDLIVNTTALTFVFTTDELMLERLSTQATKHIMSNLEDYELFDHTPYEDESDQDALDRYVAREMTWRMTSEDWWLIPRRLLWCLTLMAIFIGEYYYHNCKWSDDGWVSVDMYEPTEAHLSMLCFVSKFFSKVLDLTCTQAADEESDPFWTMP